MAKLPHSLNRLNRCLALAGLLPIALPAWAFLDRWELDAEIISETGQVLFDRFAPESIKEEYEILSAEELKAWIGPVQTALSGMDFSDLARMQPQVREQLATLRANPQTQGYADWLEARKDYFDMAAEIEQARPTPAPVTPTLPAHPAQPTPPEPARPLVPHPAAPQRPDLPPHPAAPAKPLPAHPAEPPTVVRPDPAPVPAPPPAAPTPAVAAPGKNHYADNKQLWIGKLSGRATPGRAAALLPDLKRIFREEGVPPALVWQAEAESTFNPAARSPAGAVGLYQFMPATAREYGLSLTPEDERLDALKNARAAAQYLKRLHARFGDWSLALAAYNCGQGRVSKNLRETGGTSFNDIHDRLPAETRMYVPKIAALLHLRENANLEQL